MSRLVLTLALLALSAIGAQAQNYPTRAVHGDRAVRRRRTGRHHRADRRRYLLAPPRPAVRGRERRRRRRHHRHDAGRARQCPTATLISGHLGTNALAGVLSQPRLRPGKGLRADRADRRAAGAADGPQGLPGEQPQGVRRLRQGQREQAQHGARRRRLGVLYRLPAAQQRRSASSRPWCRSPAPRRR